MSNLRDFNVGWTGAKAIKEVDTDQDFCERTYALLEEVSRVTGFLDELVTTNCNI